MSNRNFIGVRNPNATIVTVLGDKSKSTRGITGVNNNTNASTIAEKTAKRLIKEFKR